MVELVGKDAIIGRTIDTLEGGYVNNPDDVGGPTKYGITLATYRIIKPTATINDIKNLTKDQAIEAYTILFWNKYHIDSMPVDVQDVVFDTFVQHNPYTAARLIQSAVNEANADNDLHVDGTIGADTLKAMGEIDVKKLRKAILHVRKTYYVNRAANDPSQEQFLKGWLNRLVELA